VYSNLTPTTQTKTQKKTPKLSHAPSILTQTKPPTLHHTTHHLLLTPPIPLNPYPTLLKLTHYPHPLTYSTTLSSYPPPTNSNRKKKKAITQKRVIALKGEKMSEKVVNCQQKLGVKLLNICRSFKK